MEKRVTNVVSVDKIKRKELFSVVMELQKVRLGTIQKPSEDMFETNLRHPPFTQDFQEKNSKV